MAAPSGLLERLSALRQRLGTPTLSLHPHSERASPHQHLLLLEHRLGQLRAANGRLEHGLKALGEKPEPSRPPESPRFSWRVRKLLLRGREAVDKLRALMPAFAKPEAEGTGPQLHFKQAQELADFALRAAEHWPDDDASQERLAFGLEAHLATLDERIRRLTVVQARWKEDQRRLEMLGDAIQQLFQKKGLSLATLRPLALALHEEEAHGQPLRWLPFDAQRPHRWAAAAGLNAAQAIARIVCKEPEWAVRPVDVILAALLQDAGLATLQMELLTKPGLYTDDERRQMEGHVAVGADALKQALPHDGWLPEAVRLHHERPSATGYPAGAPANELSRLGKLLAVASTYAALSVPRPWRPALGPRAALTETLLDAERGRLDIPTAEHLLRLGPYPVGAFVELSDGCFAQVAGPAVPEGARPPHRPIVELLRDSRGKSVGAGQHLDLACVLSRQIVKGYSQDEARRLVGADHLELW